MKNKIMAGVIAGLFLFMGACCLVISLTEKPPVLFAYHDVCYYPLEVCKENEDSWTSIKEDKEDREIRYIKNSLNCEDSLFSGSSPWQPGNL